jgi:hypothetical protein
MAAGGKLVRRDETGFWLYSTLAGKKTGLSKNKLAARAIAGELDYRDDWPGKLWWYREDQIAALAAQKNEADRQRAAKPAKPKSDAQMIRETMKEIARSPVRRTGGPMAAHSERLTLPRDPRIPKGER